VAAKERWARAASDVLGQQVVDVVPVARKKPGAAPYYVAGVAVFAAVVFLHQFGIVPGPTILAYFVGALPMAVLFQMAADVVFVALTPSGLQVLEGSRWNPTPQPPALGPLDPALVSGPRGLLRNSYDVGGRTHQVGWQHKGRFEQMLAAAR
jgi:hypothetical protein